MKNKIKHQVYFQNQQKRFPAGKPLRDLLRRAADETLRYEAVDVPVELSVTFVDDAQIHVLNRENRGVDKPTDVLSFPQYEADEIELLPEGAALGDIVLSLERAAAQAEAYGHSFEREAAFLFVHSVLHLLGYDHEAGAAEESDMCRRQEEILAGMGLKRM